MSDPVASFGDTAKGLAKNPLGVIALFIVLVYGFAALVLGLSAANLSVGQRLPLVWFLVIFPVLVLGVFAWLVAWHPINLYGPGDFGDQKLFLELQQQLRAARQHVEVLKEMAPDVVLPPLAVPTARPAPAASRAKRAAPVPPPDDPQLGRWGGQREAGHRIVVAGLIRPLMSDPSNYRIPLEVRSTDPASNPLVGKVRFHLHDSFSPDVREVEVRDGVARLGLVAYGAFTVGVDTDDGARLEINLADADIDAPQAFKNL